MQHTDIAIIGGGIIGLATAYHLVQAEPTRRIRILEKESEIAMHQTGHNSGVLHSGIYYRPGSLKAINCRRGKAEMEAFCRIEGIDYERCGKVIVAVEEKELPILERIYRRGLQNKIACSVIDAEQLREIEPHTAGIRAIHVPEAGIVDYSQVCQALKHRITKRGVAVMTQFEVRSIEKRAESHILRSESQEVAADYIVNCAGLYADRIAVMTGASPGIKIVPFRGEYFTLNPDVHHLCSSLIYPVPDPVFPFLGVHFTKMIHGGVECGPNAVLAFAREGYTRTTFNFEELLETLTYRGFQHLARKYWKQGCAELLRSFSKKAFVRALKRLVPDIEPHHLTPAPAGVRAQAILPDGRMADDFLILESERVINVCNAPSPAATASLHVGRTIVERLRQQLAMTED